VVVMAAMSVVVVVAESTHLKNGRRHGFGIVKVIDVVRSKSRQHDVRADRIGGGQVYGVSRCRRIHGDIILDRARSKDSSKDKDSDTGESGP
jgi:hypothetical protein